MVAFARTEGGNENVVNVREMKLERPLGFAAWALPAFKVKFDDGCECDVLCMPHPEVWPCREDISSKRAGNPQVLIDTFRNFMKNTEEYP